MSIIVHCQTEFSPVLFDPMIKQSKLSDGKFWADKFMDLANLQFVVLVIGQFVSAQIQLQGFLIGFIMYIGIIIFSVHLRRQ